MTTKADSSSPTGDLAESLGISSDLLAMLVCPIDHGALEVAVSGLTCTVCHRTYPVEDGIPNMVVASSAEGER